jgi:hypothetical protein
MAIAAQLLEETDLRLTEIAPRVGCRSEFFVQPAPSSWLVASRRFSTAAQPKVVHAARRHEITIELATTLR